MARRPNSVLRERVAYSFDHPQITATTSYKVAKMLRDGVVEKVEYINPTGLAEHATDAFAGTLKNGANTVATIFDTDSDEAGTNTLAADTWVTGTISATYAEFAAGDTLTLTLTEDGTATLPAGRVVVHVIYK